MEKNKKDIMTESMEILDRLFNKSDVYGSGDTDNFYEEEVKIQEIEKNLMNFPSMKEEEEDKEFADMIPDYEGEEEFADEIEDQDEVKPEDIEFLEGVGVYKIKDVSKMNEEELDEFKGVVDDLISKLDFEINYKWLEIESSDYSEEEVEDEEVEETDELESIEEAMNEEEGDDVEPVEVEEVEEEVETDTDSLDIFLVIYDADIMAEESENDDVIELSNYLNDNFEEIDVNSEDYSFVKEEIMSEEDTDEESTDEETTDEETTDEEVVEESKDEDKEVIDGEDESEEDESEEDESEEMEESLSLKDRIKAKIKEQLLSETPGGGTGGDGGNGGDGGSGAGSSSAEEETITESESALAKAIIKLAEIKKEKLLRENLKRPPVRKPVVKENLKRPPVRKPVVKERLKRTPRRKPVVKENNKPQRLMEKLSEIKTKLKMSEEKKSERLSKIQEKIDSKRSENVKKEHSHTEESSLVESIREKIRKIQDKKRGEI